MNMMFTVGTVCWVISCFLGGLYQFESLNKMTRKGMVLKGAAAFSVGVYAVVLIAMFGQTSDAAVLFVIGLILVSIADILIAYLESIGDGSSESIFLTVTGGSNGKRTILCVAGALYIFSFFLQLVAFIKGLSHYDATTEYVMPFIIFFFLPLFITVLGGALARFKVADTDMKVFIVGAFYILLSSALFSAAAVFAFALFQIDVRHGTWVIFGSTLHAFGIMSVLLRYAKPGLYDNKAIRFTSRMILFLGRMTLAGCAFLL